MRPSVKPTSSRTCFYIPACLLQHGRGEPATDITFWQIFFACHQLDGVLWFLWYRFITQALETSAASGIAQSIFVAPYRISVVVTISRIAEGVSPAANSVAVAVTISCITQRICTTAHGIAVIVPVSGIPQRVRSTANRITLIISPGRVPQGIRPATDCIAIAVSARCILQRICAIPCLRKAIEWYNDKNNKWQQNYFEHEFPWLGVVLLQISLIKADINHSKRLGLFGKFWLIHMPIHA